MAIETTGEGMHVTGDRRLEINPDPLQMVTARPAAASPPPQVLAIKHADSYRNGTRMRRVSVHRESCPRLPADGTTGWSITPASQEKIAAVLDEADQADVPVSISCRTCGGWTSVG